IRASRSMRGGSSSSHVTGTYIEHRTWTIDATYTSTHSANGSLLPNGLAVCPCRSLSSRQCIHSRSQPAEVELEERRQLKPAEDVLDVFKDNDEVKNLRASIKKTPFIYRNRSNFKQFLAEAQEKVAAQEKANKVIYSYIIYNFKILKICLK